MARTEVGRGHGVVATLSYRLHNYQYRDLHLRIVRRGVTRFAAPVGLPYTTPAGFANARSVHVYSLGGATEPDVVVDLFSGGAHCCFYTNVYQWRSSVHGYHVLRRVWGNPPVSERRLNRDHFVDFVTADDRFAYAYSSYAFSGLPVQIWNFRHGRFVDVTRRFPRRVARDGAFWRRLYLHDRKRYPTESQGTSRPMSRISFASGGSPRRIVCSPARWRTET